MIKQIANQLNISISAVPHALHNQHSIRTKMRVQETRFSKSVQEIIGQKITNRKSMEV